MVSGIIRAFAATNQASRRVFWGAIRHHPITLIAPGATDSEWRLTRENAKPHARPVLAARQRYHTRPSLHAAEDQVSEQRRERPDAAAKLSRSAARGSSRRRRLGIRNHSAHEPQRHAYGCAGAFPV